jgi:hypothetical protein
MKAWESFVVEHGWKARALHLATVLKVPEAAVRALQERKACKKLSEKKDFAELFALWRGRSPKDHEWPTPLKYGHAYEWLPPELALLASLVGRLGYPEIAKILTARLRKITEDRRAVRGVLAVQIKANRLGLRSYDVVGGMLLSAAGKEIGSLAEVLAAVDTKKLKTIKVGRLRVIPHALWTEWKERRVRPPEDHVPLAPLRKQLGMVSQSKLAEYARAGHIPTATLMLEGGFGMARGRHGAWYVHKDMADKLVKDRRAGLPMPWQGKADKYNLKTSFKLWQKKRHPKTCTTCAGIWGKKGVPRSLEEFTVRYPSLEFGAKRHLTQTWSPGLTFPKLAKYARVPIAAVKLASKNGALVTHLYRGRRHVTLTHAARWRAGGCRTGEGRRSWISLDKARRSYHLEAGYLRKLIAAKDIPSRIINREVCVPTIQCRRLREENGYTEAEASRMLGITLKEWRHLVKGANWRQGSVIHLEAIKAVKERIRSLHGYSVAEAAEEIGRPRAWVQARIDDGTVKPSKTKWGSRVYLNSRMLARLRSLKKKGDPVAVSLGRDWLQLDAARLVAGVSGVTLMGWGHQGEVERKHDGKLWRYQVDSVKSKARSHWRTSRWRRHGAPDWVRAELAQATSSRSGRAPRAGRLRGHAGGLHSSNTRTPPQKARA